MENQRGNTPVLRPIVAVANRNTPAARFSNAKVVVYASARSRSIVAAVGAGWSR